MGPRSKHIAAALAVALVPTVCLDSGEALAGARASASCPAPSRGHPKVTLDRLDLTKTPLAAADEAFLRKALADEAKRADWGAGGGAHIEYRFRLDELSVTEEPRVVRVRCSASGFLPKGRGARSHIAFGGAPNERQAVVRHVLEIVARGVVTRLSELERRRRSH
ncbi:MAG TPA: hypothetical protein VHU80_21360 [Polyangiaceae bacterium]|jgi:hypothetical protein|nr:hypothetical protein [Polyangiaceae bacterium]